jgi:anti-anti-sigma regulatory factor
MGVTKKMTIEVIACGETFGIADVNALYPRLLTLLLEERPLVFDCSQIERIDTAALQMLYAFSKASSLYGYEINWNQASDSFINSAHLLGVATAMGIAHKKQSGH